MRRSLRSWLWRVPLDQEVDEEIALHVELRTRELVERGLDPKTARDIVLSRIGDLGELKRTCVDLGRKRDREMRLTQWLDERKADDDRVVQLTGCTGVAADAFNCRSNELALSERTAQSSNTDADAGAELAQSNPSGCCFVRCKRRKSAKSAPG